MSCGPARCLGISSPFFQLELFLRWDLIGDGTINKNNICEESHEFCCLKQVPQLVRRARLRGARLRAEAQAKKSGGGPEERAEKTQQGQVPGHHLRERKEISNWKHPRTTERRRIAQKISGIRLLYSRNPLIKYLWACIIHSDRLNWEYGIRWLELGGFRCDLPFETRGA